MAWWDHEDLKDARYKKVEGTEETRSAGAGVITCNKELQALGYSYPRTCAACKLSGCKNPKYATPKYEPLSAPEQVYSVLINKFARASRDDQKNWATSLLVAIEVMELIWGDDCKRYEERFDKK